MVALTRLAREYGNGAILISELAKSERLPQRFLENILLELKKMGILGSKLGKSGGYFLLRHPKDVNLAEIVRQFEGPIALLYCVCLRKPINPVSFAETKQLATSVKYLRKSGI